MSEGESFDVLIIGAGQAAIPLAHGLAKVGKRVGLAEREHLGGSCVNFGCTPTKAVISSARMVHQARRAAEFGVNISAIEIDFQAVLERAKRILMESRKGLREGLENSDNPKLLQGHAKIEGRKTDWFQGALTTRQLLLRRWCSTPAHAASSRRLKVWLTLTSSILKTGLKKPIYQSISRL